uniref:Uncharacterized protein n=1 Tax=Haptolina brevifila TaxID=156173 RepID=A0A7S2CGA6_9EUKA|mmetsp:Transcript_24559/g.49220  ORF Transcript_24559/g.49220 Transcript_24559/m.49220 type:complete len:509 (+) Transcript_24559:112-1638(+)
MSNKRVTRSRTQQIAASVRTLSSKVLSSTDIQSLLLPSLDFRTFVAFRVVSKDLLSATQHVCEDLIQVLEHAAALYVSPKFAEALELIAQHQPHIGWLLQTPVLAVVAPARHDELIAKSYHLLQARLSRLQKLSVSISLRRASQAPRRMERESSRFMLMHLGVRLGMFTESHEALVELLEAAETAVKGLQELQRSAAVHLPDTAAAHYTLAGFYTYHHRRPELSDALKKAQQHLAAALRIQSRTLGPRHVSTLCSQLVKAQVMLLQSNTAGCARLLTKQLEYCEDTLSPQHPLAAKMLAVMARLRNKQGDEVECGRLQQRVLSMRRSSLGLHHEDTHRSAMDVYTRRRHYVLRESYDEQGYVDMAAAMEVCFEMLQHATLDEGGVHGFALSKSLQGMGDILFQDMAVLAKRGLWSRERTLSLISAAADTAERLPPTPLSDRTIEVGLAAAAAAAGHPFTMTAPPPQHLPAAAAQTHMPPSSRTEIITKLRQLHATLASATEWPPIPLH